jgi:hypothetical protein
VCARRASPAGGRLHPRCAETLRRPHSRGRAAPFDDARIDRNLAQEVHAQLVGNALAAVLPEDVVAAVREVGRHEERHVLDDAEDRHCHLLEHAQALACIDHREVVGGRHDHGAGERRLLRQGERGVARPGRKVDDQVVELAPFDVGQELADQAVHHRPAPDDR